MKGIKLFPKSMSLFTESSLSGYATAALIITTIIIPTNGFFVNLSMYTKKPLTRTAAIANTILKNADVIGDIVTDYLRKANSYAIHAVVNRSICVIFEMIKAAMATFVASKYGCIFAGPWAAIPTCNVQRLKVFATPNFIPIPTKVTMTTFHATEVMMTCVQTADTTMTIHHVLL